MKPLENISFTGFRVRSFALMISLLFLFLSRGSTQTVSFTERPGITDMLERHIFLNQQNKTMEGWRVQILATTDRMEMERTRQNFQFAYPEITVTWVHEKPWYKLRAGAFATKLDAIHLQNVLKPSYPGAYPTKDLNIEARELLN